MLPRIFWAMRERERNVRDIIKFSPLYYGTRIGYSVNEEKRYLHYFFCEGNGKLSFSPRFTIGTYFKNIPEIIIRIGFRYILE